MDLKEAIKILEEHNKWRRGAEVQMTDPKKLGIAIEVILIKIKERCLTDLT